MRLFCLLRRYAAFSLPALSVLLSSGLYAQTIPLTLNTSVKQLTSWRFSPGDDMAWAQPGFDDSRWKTLYLIPPADSYDPTTGVSGFVPGWTTQGFQKLHYYAWYRTDLNITNPSGQPLAIRMPDDFDDAYQVYVNGRLVGGFGDFTSRGVTFYNAQPRSFPLPEDVRSGPVTIAVRFWMDPATPFISPDVGGMHGPPMLGIASNVDAMYQLSWREMSDTQLFAFLTLVLGGFTFLLGIVLFWIDRGDYAYLWLAMASFMTLFRVGVILAGYFTMTVSMETESILSNTVLPPVTMGCWILFWAYWFRLRGIRILFRWVLVIGLVSMASLQVAQPGTLGVIVPVSASAWSIPVSVACRLALGVLLLFVTWRGIRKQGAEGWVLLPVVLLSIVALYLEDLQVLHIPTTYRFGKVVFNLRMVSQIVTFVLITVLLLRRFILGQREHVKVQQEIEQARQVQQVLIPEALPPVAGFELASEYRPAQEVGGDFFQLMPTANGGVLAVMGDVSGKGTPAAMTVSLLVGAVRTIARFTERPGEILAELNTRMMGRASGGFTTCMVLRADPDGALTMANAGHLPPLLNGHELKTDNGLPLGIAEGIPYGETTARLAAGQQLTLLTDGVVEARDRDGELFGFERTAGIAT